MGRKRARSPAGTDFSTCGRCSEGDSQDHSESDGRNEERQDEEDEQNQEESQRDQEPSESDGDDESLDEEEQEMQIDQELAEADGDEEGAQDEEDEQNQEEIQRDQEPSESDGDDESLDEEEQEMQIDQELAEADGDEEGAQDEEDEQNQEEIQRDQEPSESDGDDESLDEEEQEMQIDQELAEADGDAEEENEEESEGDEEEENGAQDEEDEQVDQERQMHQESPESDEQEEENEQVVDNSDGGRVPEIASEPVLDPPPFKSTSLVSLTLQDENMLDCGVCCFPLKPPIFQCSVGHVVCSSCRDKLAAEGRCHVCRTLIAGGYRRCHALEQLVDSILGSCPNGCAAPKMRHYDLRDHLQACTHACHCPERDCDFAGSTAAFIHHLVGTHKWPCITGVKHKEVRVTHLRYGFNFVVVVHQGRDYIFLLRVVRINDGRAISCLCIRPQAAAADDSSPPPSKYVSCKVELFHMPDIFKRSFILSIAARAWRFNQECTNLSNGMPKLRDCEHFMVSDRYLPEPADTVKVNVTFAIGCEICLCQSQCNFCHRV